MAVYIESWCALAIEITDAETIGKLRTSIDYLMKVCWLRGSSKNWGWGLEQGRRDREDREEAMRGYIHFLSQVWIDDKTDWFVIPDKLNEDAKTRVQIK